LPGAAASPAAAASAAATAGGGEPNFKRFRKARSSCCK
jgi:hypothetical protein